MYKIMASEIGFEFDVDVEITCDREPQTEADWLAISEFVEESFPLTNDEISHGFAPHSCMVYLPENE